MRRLTIQSKALLLTVVGSMLVVCIFSGSLFAQGTLQRQVKISNANGNIITLQSDTPTTSFTISLPNNPNPSATTASLLFGIGSGNMAWSSTLGADSGHVLQLNRVGSKLVPSWRSMANLNYVTNDEPILTFSNDRGSLTDNRVFSVGSGLSITNSGVDNGNLIVANTGVLKLTAGSGITVSDTTGNIVISSRGWQLGGNTGTTPWNGTIGDYLGTTDDQDLVLGAGSSTATRERLRINNSTGNIRISTSGAQLQLQGTGSGITSFQAGAQGNTNINYTLPTALPSQDGQVLAASTAGVLTWSTPSGGLTGSGTATRIAFWGPGPGTTTNLMDDTTLYYDNTNKRLSLGAGVSPLSTLHTITSGVKTATSISTIFSNTATSTTNNITKTGLEVQSTGNWTGTAATNIGLVVQATGGTNNYSALFGGGNVGIGTTSPSQLLTLQNGNLYLSNNDGNAAILVLQGTGTGASTISSGAQGTNTINYVLPTSLPTAGQQLTASTITGTGPYNVAMGWAAAGTSGGSSGWGLTGNAGTTAGTNFIGTTDNVDWVVKTDNSERLRVLSTGEIGVGTTTPNTQLDLTGDIATREFNYTTAVPTTLNNANFDGASNQVGFIRLSNASAPFSITGIAGGVNGKMMSIYNATGQSMTIVNQSSSSTAANRMITGTSANIPLSAGGTANFLYSAQDSRWVVRSISGTAGWLYTGNSGLVDGTSNFHGTLDSIPIRFVAGNNGPKQRMVLDPRGNLLFGSNSANTTFATGSAGKLAFGDSLNTLRLNSLPNFGARVFSMIDPNAVVRVWRFRSNAGGTDPAVELIGGTDDIELDDNNQKWDFYSTGTPGVPWSGTKSQGEHFAVRRRTQGNDSVYLAVFAGSGVRIGSDTTGTARYTPYKLAVLSEDQNTNGIMNMAALEHLAMGNAAAGLGSGLLFRGETSLNDTVRDMARIAGIWTNVTDGSRSGALTFSTVDDASAMTERARIASNGYVGINTTAPETRLDIDGAYATRAISLSLSNGRNDNINIGDASFVRITGPTDDFSISGIDDGTDGKRVRIVNTTGQEMTIINQSTNSSSDNRIETGTDDDVTIGGTEPVLDMIYDATSSGKWLFGTLSANHVVGPIGSIVYKSKTADETVTSTATIQDDNHLFFDLPANQTWELNGQLQVDNTSNNVNVKVAFQLPSGATMKMYVTGIQDAGGNAIQGSGLMTTSNASKTILISGGVSTLLTFRGVITTGSSSGTVEYRWAQGTSNNSGTITRSGSYMKIMRVE